MYLQDPNGVPVREFYSQHTNAGGVVSLTYALSPNLLSFGDWSVEVLCREQLYNRTFRVIEFCKFKIKFKINKLGTKFYLIYSSESWKLSLQFFNLDLAPCCNTLMFVGDMCSVM